MMKRIIVLALALVLTLSLTTAFAWSCPSCGSSMDSKFCTECGTKKPENICPNCGTNHGEQVLNFCTECGTKLGEMAAPTAVPTAVPTAAPTAVPTAAPTAVPQATGPVITKVVEEANSTITVLWEGDGMTEYMVRYFPKKSDDPQADMDAKSSVRGYIASSNTGVSASLTKTVPGESYWIGLFDGEERGQYIAFEPTVEVTAFTAMDAALECYPSVQVGEESSRTEHFTLAQISGETGESCGVFLAASYNNSGAEYKPVAKIVLENPQGEKQVMYAAYLTFSAGKADMAGWSYLDLSAYFSNQRQVYGEEILGEHKVSLYLDGKLLGTQPILVAADEAAAAEETAAETDDLEIIAIMENDDGSASIVWNGQIGKTYQVRYLLKQSDDVMADMSAANSIGYYYSESTIGVYTLSKLVPGESYWIGIFDEAGDGHYEPYVPKTKAQPFTAFDMTVYALPTLRQNDEDTRVDYFLSSQIASDSGVKCGLYLVLQYTNSTAECQPRIQVAVEAPNGAKKVLFSSVHTFKVAENEYEGWSFFDLSEYVTIMEKYFGAVPEGEHKVSVYLDGEVAGTVPFMVQK